MYERGAKQKERERKKENKVESEWQKANECSSHHTEQSLFGFINQKKEIN